MEIGVDTLPPLPKDSGDRNRTSPFAFTGNKFEFRAVGSNQSISGPLVILNTIVAESLDYIATELEKATKGDASKLNARCRSCSRRSIKEHKAIIFNGDGYSEAWHKEAAKRGLPNLRNTVEALGRSPATRSGRAVREVQRADQARTHAPATTSTPSVTARM
jgi:glutamine synthetase